MRLERHHGVAYRSTEDAVDREAQAAFGVQLDLQRFHRRTTVARADRRHQQVCGPTMPSEPRPLRGLERLGGGHSGRTKDAVGRHRLTVVLQEVLDRGHVRAAIATALSREERIRIIARRGAGQAHQQDRGQHGRAESFHHRCLQTGAGGAVQGGEA